MAAVFKILDRVQEVASPHRKGTVKAVAGVGVNAVITVGLDGRPPVNFRPADLKLL